MFSIQTPPMEIANWIKAAIETNKGRESKYTSILVDAKQKDLTAITTQDILITKLVSNLTNSLKPSIEKVKYCFLHYIDMKDNGARREHLAQVNKEIKNYIELEKNHKDQVRNTDCISSNMDLLGIVPGRLIHNVNRLIEPLAKIEQLFQSAKTDCEMLFLKIVYALKYDEVKKSEDFISLNHCQSVYDSFKGDLNILNYFNERDLEVRSFFDFLNTNGINKAKQNKIMNAFKSICLSEITSRKKLHLLENTGKKFDLHKIFLQKEFSEVYAEALNLEIGKEGALTVKGRVKSGRVKKGSKPAFVSAAQAAEKLSNKNSKEQLFVAGSVSVGEGGGGSGAPTEAVEKLVNTRDALTDLIQNAFFNRHHHPITEHQRVKRWNGPLTPELIRKHPEKFETFLPADDDDLNLQILFHAGEGVKNIFQIPELLKRFAFIHDDGRIEIKCRMRYKGQDDYGRQKEVSGRLIFGMDITDPHKVFHRAFHRDMWGAGVVHYLKQKIEKSEETEEEGSFELVGDIEPQLLDNDDIYIKYKNHSFLDGVTICQIKS